MESNLTEQREGLAYKRAKYDIHETLVNMKKVRLEAGLTQMQMARILNVDPTYISKWERGKAVPDYANLVALYRVLHGLMAE